MTDLLFYIVVFSRPFLLVNNSYLRQAQAACHLDQRLIDEHCEFDKRDREEAFATGEEKFAA